MRSSAPLQLFDGEQPNQTVAGPCEIAVAKEHGSADDERAQVVSLSRTAARFASEEYGGVAATVEPPALPSEQPAQRSQRRRGVVEVYGQPDGPSDGEHPRVPAYEADEHDGRQDANIDEVPVR